MKNVTWSQRLWTQAKKWADYLARNNKFHHESSNPGNLFLSPGQPADPCARAVKYFYLEEKYYNYKKPQYYRAAGHFTQVRKIANKKFHRHPKLTISTYAQWSVLILQTLNRLIVAYIKRRKIN